MIKEYKISENVLELEDLMVNYLYGKGDYPPKVREALDNLNNAILDTYSEQAIEDYAMDEAIREVENRRLGVETNIANFQRRQNANNNFSAVIPYDLEQQRQESKEFLDDLTTRDQRMFVCLITMVHTESSKEKLDEDTESLLSIGRKHLCQLGILKYQQLDGLITAIPFGVKRIDILRTLTTDRKSTRLNSSHDRQSRMPSSA